MLQNVFETKSSSTDSLYQFVSSYLTDNSATNLSLYQAPPKRLVKPGLSLVDADLTATTLLHAGGDIVLKADVKVESDTTSALEQLSGVVGKRDSANDSLGSISRDQPASVIVSEQQQTAASRRPKDSKPVPKWFKLK